LRKVGADQSKSMRVHTLSELDDWKAGGTSLAVLGDPVAHSLSPSMHNAALRAMAKEREEFSAWAYYPFKVTHSELPDALPKFHRMGFRGLNLTVPHKVQALELVLELDDCARGMGAVNTLVWLENGWRGENTDGYGIEKAVAEEFGRGFRGCDVVLLGAGGVARAAAVRCLDAGCRTLRIGNRSRKRLDDLLQILARHPEGTRASGFDLGTVPEGLPGDAILINLTSLGLKPDDPSPIALGGFPSGLVVYDTTYNDRETNGLRREAEARSIPYADGLSMLVRQGALSLERWTGCNVPVDVMRKAAEEERNRRTGS
jgi:shikimate dehydrogenase